MYYVHLPLKNAFNVRELGGYPCGDGQVTRWHSFLRGDDLSALDSGEIQFLTDYGLSAVVDLRGPEELASNPDPFATHPGVAYRNIPLAIGNVSDVTKGDWSQPAQFIPAFYMKLITQAQPAIREVLTFMAEQASGCVLFHCTVGKDRTGVIAMLLLGLAGVSESDIMANYEVTFSYIKYSPLIELPESIPQEVMHSKTDYLAPAFHFILREYGTVENYLLAIGLERETLSRLKDKLTGVYCA